MTVDVQLNEHRRVDVVYIGNENTPVVVIDDVISSLDSLCTYAQKHGHFTLDERFAYPGVRAPLPEAYGACIKPVLEALMAEVFHVPNSDRSRLIHQFFSLITLKPRELSKLQRVPHFDTHDPLYFATVHYLGSGPHSGTGFFRHRPTGYERISKERFPGFVQAANRHMQTHGSPPKDYINATTDHFELISSVAYRPNRMLMYPGNLLHSGLIEPQLDINSDPTHGRLTANLFLHIDSNDLGQL